LHTCIHMPVSAHIIASRPTSRKRKMAKHLTPQTIDALINQALAIEDEQAQEAGALGFMARAMVQATLPHRAVAGNEFERRNGNFTLTLQAPSKIGLPYGSVPRLLLAWVTTEAVKTKSRELELGDSMSAFMAELGMTPTGGANGSITRLKNQTRRLFAATVTASYEDDKQIADMGYRLADRSVLWWHSKDPEQAGLWKSSVTLSEHFFNEVIDRPVPIDMRAMKALKQSPMALDIYAWLTYRVSYLKRPTVIPWASLAMQFGSNYAQLRQFKAAFLDELKKVVLVYGQVQVEATELGLTVKPSMTHIPMTKGKP
jgi:hypothetical protein